MYKSVSYLLAISALLSGSLAQDINRDYKSVLNGDAPLHEKTVEYMYRQF